VDDALGSALFDDELHAANNNMSVTADTMLRRTATPLRGDGTSSVRSRRMSGTRDTESVERVIPAPAEKIFALLADPSRHREIDGSGSVRDAKQPSQRVKLGDTFGMAMRLGLPYTMVSTVVEFEDDRRIAWQSRPPGVFGKISGGRIWRYELEPADGGTRVRETWDISQEVGTKFMLTSSRVHRHTRAAMEKTLENIEKLLSSTP
jgi:uncharacterized protein YndB with AHSA1/START domain